MTTERRLEAILAPAGVQRHGFLAPAEIPFDPAVRAICQGNTCRGYGATWACPPGVGTFEDCRAQCLAYRRALVFSTSYPLEDSFDFAAMRAGMLAFKEVCDRLGEAAGPIVPGYLLLSNEGCFCCAACTYPDAPCRFPEKLHPSIEGYGILVSELARRTGIPYGVPGAVTYFGALLFSSADFRKPVDKTAKWG